MELQHLVGMHVREVGKISRNSQNLISIKTSPSIFIFFCDKGLDYQSNSIATMVFLMLF